MSSLILKSIPYKIGPLTDTSQQLPISWIKNGEPLNGSTSNVGSDGTLNRVSLEIQTNVEALAENDTSISQKIDSMSENLDTINEALGTGVDQTLAARVTVNEADISELKKFKEDTATSSAATDLSIKAIKDDIGDQQESGDTYYRTVRDDLLYIKRQVGNDAGFDINGQAVDNLGSSGIKNKLESVSQAASNQENRIVALEDMNSAFDFGKMSSDLTAIRKELGESNTAPTDTVYKVIGSVQQSIESLDSSNDSIKTAIDITNENSIADRTTKLESAVDHLITEVDDGETGISLKVNNITTEIGTDTTPGSIKGNISKLTASVDSLEDIVGTDNHSGISARTSYIETKLGQTADDQTPTKGSILDLIPKHTQQLDDISGNVQNVQLALPNKVDDVTDSSLYVRTEGAWKKQASSVVYLTYSGTVDTKTDTSTDIDLSKGSNARILNNSSQVSNGFQLNDDGIYDIDIELVLTKDQSAASYTLDLVNGDIVATSSSGYSQAVSGKQVVRLTTMLKSGANAMFKLALTSSVAQTTTIDSLRIKVKPII